MESCDEQTIQERRHRYFRDDLKPFGRYRSAILGDSERSVLIDRRIDTVFYNTFAKTGDEAERLNPV
jgi:hypothetical protein